MDNNNPNANTGHNPNVNEGYNQSYNSNMNSGYNQNVNGNYNQNMNSGYNQNVNGSYNPSMNNGYNQNMNGGYNPNVNNGYNQNINGGYNPNMYGGNGQGYNNMPYMQNTPPMKPKKRRKTGPVVLSIFIAILLVLDISFIGLKTGIFSEGTLKDMLIKVSENMKDDIYTDIPKTNEEAVRQAMDKIAGYVSDFLLNGEFPGREEVTQDMGKIYDMVIEESAEEVIKDLEAAGEIEVDNLNSYEHFADLKDFLGTSQYNKLIEKIRDDIGDTIIVNKDTKDILKSEIIDETKIYRDEKVKEIVDELYSQLDDIEADVSADMGDVPINEIVSGVTAFLQTAIIVISVIIGIMLLLSFILDRDLYLSFKGLFPTLLVPGLIILIPAALLRGLMYLVASSAGASDATSAKAIDVMSDKGLMPLIIISAIVIVVAIVCKIVSVIIKKAGKEDIA